MSVVMRYNTADQLAVLIALDALIQSSSDTAEPSGPVVTTAFSPSLSIFSLDVFPVLVGECLYDLLGKMVDQMPFFSAGALSKWCWSSAARVRLA